MKFLRVAYDLRHEPTTKCSINTRSFSTKAMLEDTPSVRIRFVDLHRVCIGLVLEAFELRCSFRMYSLALTIVCFVA